jgi:hypothetical protein
VRPFSTHPAADAHTARAIWPHCRDVAASARAGNLSRLLPVNPLGPHSDSRSHHTILHTPPPWSAHTKQHREGWRRRSLHVDVRVKPRWIWELTLWSLTPRAMAERQWNVQLFSLVVHLSPITASDGALSLSSHSSKRPVLTRGPRADAATQPAQHSASTPTTNSFADMV